MTRWKPDTCRCVIEFDGHNPDGSQNVVSILKCAEHISDVKAHESVLDENQSKNKAIGKLIEDNPEMSGRESDVLVIFDFKRDIKLSLPTDMKHLKDSMNSKDLKLKKKVTFE